MVLEQVETDEQTVIEQSQLDQMWSYVGKKTNQRCLWHTIELKTGRILTYVFGQRKDEVFLKLKKLLKPFGIKKYGHALHKCGIDSNVIPSPRTIS